MAIWNNENPAILKALLAAGADLKAKTWLHAPASRGLEQRESGHDQSFAGGRAQPEREGQIWLYAPAFVRPGGTTRIRT